MATMSRSDSIESLSLSLSLSGTSHDYDVLEQPDANNHESYLRSHQLSEDEFILKLSQVLGLDESTDSKIIVKQLMIKGRQALCEFEDDIIRRIYQQQMTDDNSELLELLKNYMEQQWQSINETWFQQFLTEQKTSSTDLYDQILTRTAEYGSKFMKDNAVLSLTIQFLFELNDDAMQNDTFFTKIWSTLIAEGRQAIEQFSENIPRKLIREQLESYESPLYLALHEYYRQPLKDFLKQKELNITKSDMINTALHCVTDCGWWKGLNDRKFEDLLAPNKFRTLKDKLKSYLEETGSVPPPPSPPTVKPPTTDPFPRPIPSPEPISLPPPKHEIRIILMCIKEYEKLQLSTLVEAGELMYINQEFNHVLNKIIQDFESQKDFTSFMHNCLTPIMYLLKRHQSLKEFIDSLFYKYSQVQSSSISPKLSLRMIIHILLLNSDSSLSRMVMSLLSKRNPVPFLEPLITHESHQFVPDIIHVWNYSTPTILSFGIGPCSGKSTLLNRLFMSAFEQSSESIYFQTTIDIDFGYSFLSPRSINIADTHGLITKAWLIKIHELFDGFIIHIEYEYFLNNPDTIFDLLKILPDVKYKLIILRDVPLPLINSSSTIISSRFSFNPSIQSFVLPHIADQSNIQNTHHILTLQGRIFEQAPTNCLKDHNYLKMELRELMNIEFKQHLDDTYGTVTPLKQKLIQAARDNSNVDEYFPEYSKFVELCDLQLKLARFNFYGNENDTIVYDVRRKIYELNDPVVSKKDGQSIIFSSFLNVLKSSNMLTCLELLAKELKQERARVVSTGDMANQLPVQKSLSLEVLWRNAIVCSQHQSSDEQEFLYKKYYEYIKAGFPFEIIDGDNFYFQSQFLSQTLAPFQDKRTLVISVIGPQNSGKSTLLNYMFGTLFDVRDGRCTRGIYGSFVKSNRPEFDYIMLIDTEGLLGIEREDPEYDRRIVLFCLAVSHIVIVNMVGEVSSTLQTMLTLCTDSLEKMGVTRIPQPVVHFILNQRADLNIENNRAAIDRIISDLKKFGLGQSVDIRKETFHTLPSAFKKEGQTLASTTRLPTVIKTEPDFIERVQLLCGEILNSAGPCLARSFESSDPLQWLTSSKTIFDTLQKFSDLTYYRDINERRLDNEIREHIRNHLTQVFTSDYRDQLIIDSLQKTEEEIRQLFEIKQNKIQEMADQNVENLFKLLKAPDTIRQRSREFLRTQIIEMFNALRTTTIANNEREKVKLLVRNGAGDLQKLIDDTINRGTQMSSDVAAREFDQMFNRSIEMIKRTFVPDERLRQAIKHIYTNYNIYEKECLPDYQHILHHLTMLSNWNDSQAPIIDLKDEFVSCFTQLAYRHCPVTAHHFNPQTTALYSLDIIKNLVYLNKQLLEQYFISYFNQYSPQTLSSDYRKRKDGNRSKNKGFLHQVVYTLSSPFRYSNDSKQNQQLTQQTSIASTEHFQMDIRDTIQKEKPVTLTSSHIDERNVLLGLSKFIQEIMQRIMKAMEGVEHNDVRQIRTELIQKVVGLINTLIIDIDNELSAFCLSLSRPLKSMFHTCTIVLLTKYYYDEQIRHFLQTVSDIENRETDLKNYFINMVVPNASVDTNYAVNLAKQFKEHLIEKLTADGQRTIDTELKQYDCLNRRFIQDRCDGQLLANNDIRWHLDYIENPTKIIEQFFNELWSNVQESMNQKLMGQKSGYINIINEFFYCLQGIADTVCNLGSAVRFVDDIFQSEENNALDAHKNLINKKRCMTILLYKYLTGQSIHQTYVINTTTYRLRKDTLDSFELLSQQRKPSDILMAIIKQMTLIYDNISIGNLVAFLQALLNEKTKTINEFNQVKTDFNSIDTHDTHARLLDRIRGCPNLCPCCKRPCDVDHTQIKSRPGALYNEHRCVSGHALRAMNGYKFEITEEASLLMCEQIKDEQIIVVGSSRCQWSQFKKDHADWNFDSTLNDDELNRLHGKFLTVWGKVGRELCQKYNMKFVTHNTPLRITHDSFHYILLLDGSGSMTGDRWKDLLKAVAEFINRRRALQTNDRMTIIVFSDSVYIACYDDKLDEVDLTTVQFPDGGTNFSAAFTSVNECIERARKDAFSTSAINDYAIVFMSDGEDKYPEKELDKLLQAHDSVIKRFWTLALGDQKSKAMKTLEKINTKMNGSMFDVATSADLVGAYAEVANNSSSNSST